MQFTQVSVEPVQVQPLEEELEDEDDVVEELPLEEEVHSIGSGAQKSGAPSTQQVGEPVEHDTKRPARLQEGIPPFKHKQVVPEEELEVVEELPEEDDEVVEEPLLEEELEEELEEGPQIID